MPLPTPNKKESKSDFVSRCVSALSDKDEFSDSEQRVAVCYAQYDKSKKSKAMEDIKIPLEAKTTVNSDGNTEVTIASKYSDSEAGLYKSYMSMCASDDKAFVDTEGMDKDKTWAACGLQYDKMRAMMNEYGEGGLTEEQKKLPPALQKAILEKMKKDGKMTEEESDAAIKTLLCKDHEKEPDPKGEKIEVKEEK